MKSFNPIFFYIRKWNNCFGGGCGLSWSGPIVVVVWWSVGGQTTETDHWEGTDHWDEGTKALGRFYQK